MCSIAVYLQRKHDLTGSSVESNKELKRMVNQWMIKTFLQGYTLRKINTAFFIGQVRAKF